MKSLPFRYKPAAQASEPASPSNVHSLALRAYEKLVPDPNSRMGLLQTNHAVVGDFGFS